MKGINYMWEIGMIYEIKFINQNTNIIDKLINDGYACNDENRPEVLNLLIKKIDDTNKTIYRIPGYESIGNYYKDKNDNPIEKLAIKKDYDDTLFYTTNWSPNFIIPKALSCLYPDEIIEIKGYDISYIKNNKWCNKIGEKIQTGLYGININLVKKINDTTYEINLPIGEKNDKWGKIIFNEKDVSLYSNRYNITFTENNYLRKKLKQNILIV